jgi:dTDP-4-amino-4,6-dideoxygalactose transaminase
MRIYLSPPDVGELERSHLLRALDEGWVAPAGPDLAAFERDVADMVGLPAAVALSSGTAALHLALLAVGVQPGDEVLVSTFTFAASVNAIRYCGAEPVFIDSETSSWNMSPQLLRDELDRARRSGRLPAAVVVVDLYGQCADYDALLEPCRELGIPVVEDAAEALGATYRGRPAGSFGDVGVFSFNGNKIITTSGGGMLVSADEALAARVRYLATQAREPVVHYEHVEVGYNYRLSNLLAALGRGQLERLGSFIGRRRAVNARYRERLAAVPGCHFMPVPEWSGWNGWLTAITFDDPHLPGAVQQVLADASIESRPLWKPMHLQPVFRGHRACIDGISDGLFQHGLCLPSGSSLTDDEVDEVASLVVEVVDGDRRSDVAPEYSARSM